MPLLLILLVIVIVAAVATWIAARLLERHLRRGWRAHDERKGRKGSASVRKN